MSSTHWDALLLAGPTASGKSALALELAERLGGVIINADSMQVYADLSILSARPEKDETAAISHLLYGHIDGAINYSVGLWRADAASSIAAARAEGKLPIITGGTGLYFKALEQGLAQMPQVPENVRHDIRKHAETLDSEELHRWLAGQDAETAARLRASDRQRIIRALEIFTATGQSLAFWQRQPHTPPLLDASRCLRLFLAPDRQELYRRIDMRFDVMVERGAIEEAKRLAARQLDPALPVMRAHGVPGFLDYLNGQTSLDAAIQRGKSDTRHYAKRQFTWFRHQMPGWHFTGVNEARQITR